MTDQTHVETMHLPPYSGEETTCVKCQYPAAFTRYRPASGPGVVEFNGVTQWRGPFPERLERTCARCDFQWDEALVSPDS